MIDSALYHRLAPVNRRFQLRRLFMTLALVWSLATAIGLLFWILKSSGQFYSVATLPVLLALTFVASLIGIWYALRGEDKFDQTAQELEQKYPDLDSSLITAVEQQPTRAHATLGYLQQEVVRKAVYHGYQNSWSKVVPQWQLLLLTVLAAIGLLSFMVTIVGQAMTSSSSFASPVAEKEANSIFAEVPTGSFEIEPGDVEVERFTSLMVLARFAPDRLPANAELVFWDEQQKETRQSMNKALDDPLFGTRIGSVTGPLEYTVQFDGTQSKRFKISVFEFPALKRADAKLVFPEYTGMEDKLAQDVRRVSGVMGTKLTWMLTLNKPVKTGRLLGRDGQEFELVQDPAEANRYLVDMTLNKSMKFELELTDDQDRKNKSNTVLTVQAIGNQVPEIKQLAPGADVEVSPVEELNLAATFRDDFGVERAGVTYSMLGKEPVEIELASEIEARKRHEASYSLKFEPMDVNPNEIVSLYFWAEDRAPDGSQRRTVGDFYLITVREFESIFRQGQQQAGGGGQQQGGGGQQGGGQGEQAGELADLQREIVFAIWNMQRREVFETVSENFEPDVQVISQSQTEAVGLLDQMAEELPDPSMKPIADMVREFQLETVKHLDAASGDRNVLPLADALVSAQSAYQGLMQMRNIEADVVQGQQQQQQQQQGGGGGGNRQRQQMQQLELDADENRYESENTASEQTEAPEDRENRQVLSRLRELARRQNDLNERIKELQSALEEAETEQDRQEIEEQLKRLQDEQQQILRDTEELQERMENPENQSEMGEQAEQLEQARDNARQASDALEEGDVSRAAAEGTRALQDMEELRDEFQNRSSGQFDQQMQQMRNEARDIEKEQQEIAEEMEQTAETSTEQRKSLTETDDDDSDLEDRLNRQRSRVESLREEMRETIEKAEEFEPLLAERLYDTYRRTQQNSPEEALESTANSLERGFMEDAQREQRRAARNIETLREGIDEAAESVLGDETEALRRANRELQRLANSLEGEFDRANPDQADEQDRRGDQQQPGQPGEQQGEGEGESDREADENEDAQANREGEGEGENPGRGRGNPDSEDEPQGEGGQSEEPSEQQQRGNGGQQGQPSDDDESEETERPEGQGEGEPGEGEPGEGQGSSDQPPQDGQPNGGRGQGDQPPEDTERRDQRGNGAGRPNLRNNQSPQGRFGADPQMNFDEETWNDPITGEDFTEWSDRMRDVEEMVADPELRAEAARIRENARSIRKEIKRHSREPNWDLIKLKVIEPMYELQDRVHEELIRRSDNKSLIPVDRDPVPAEFEDAVQKYFEELGRGQ